MIKLKTPQKMLAMTIVMISTFLLSSWTTLEAAAIKSDTKKDSPTLKMVQKRGYLRCGVAPNDTSGFRYTVGDSLEGFDIDFCKALSAAIFGDETRVENISPATWDDRFVLLQDAEIDVLFAVASLTSSRDIERNLDFPVDYFYDVIDSEIIDVLGPAVAHGDQKWADIVRWVVYGIIHAEELGVNSNNVFQMVDDPPAEEKILVLLGLAGNLGNSLGLKSDFMVNVISSVGNYAEVYDRNLEPHFPRYGSLNMLWNEGGLLKAPMLR